MLAQDAADVAAWRERGLQRPSHILGWEAHLRTAFDLPRSWRLDGERQAIADYIAANGESALPSPLPADW